MHGFLNVGTAQRNYMIVKIFEHIMQKKELSEEYNVAKSFALFYFFTRMKLKRKLYYTSINLKKRIVAINQKKFVEWHLFMDTNYFCKFNK